MSHGKFRIEPLENEIVSRPLPVVEVLSFVVDKGNYWAICLFDSRTVSAVSIGRLRKVRNESYN